MKEKWTKEYQYSILAYLNNKREIETIAILDICVETPKTIKAIEYPFDKNSTPYLLGIDSKREKESGWLFEKVGDWSFLGHLSKKEIKEAREILKTKRTLEDIN